MWGKEQALERGVWRFRDGVKVVDAETLWALEECFFASSGRRVRVVGVYRPRENYVVILVAGSAADEVIAYVYNVQRRVLEGRFNAPMA